MATRIRNRFPRETIGPLYQTIRPKMIRDVFNTQLIDDIFPSLLERCVGLDEALSSLRRLGYDHQIILNDIVRYSVHAVGRRMLADGTAIRGKMVAFLYSESTPVKGAPNHCKASTVLAFENAEDAVYIRLLLER
jgi:hypothetical protein